MQGQPFASASKIGRRVVVILAMVMSGHVAAQMAAPPPNTIEAFWQAPAVRDNATILLWSFDDVPGQSSGANNEIETLLGAAEDAESASVVNTTYGNGPRIVDWTGKGETAIDPNGKFGKGMKLGGKGWLESAPIKLSDNLAQAGMLTIECWVNPADDRTEAILFTLPGPGGTPAVSVMHGPEGAISLVAKGVTAAIHPRRAQRGVWTHVAVLLARFGSCQLFVDGAPLILSTEQGAPVSAALQAFNARMLCVGGCGDAPGFAGILDGVRISLGHRRLYELAEASLYDTAAQQPLFGGPPWFARASKMNVYCTFDGSLKPREFAGVQAEGDDSKAVFRDGIRGRALDLSRGVVSNFALGGSAVFPRERGTIEFWLRPLSWDNLFQGMSGKAPLPLLGFARRDAPPGHSVRDMLVITGRTPLDLRGNPPWTAIHPGKWTHIACIWDGNATAVYVDGVRQAANQIAFLGARNAAEQAAYTNHLAKGADADDGSYRLTFYKSETLIDELRVYPWSLNDMEIGNAYARYLPGAKEHLRELDRLSVSTSYDYYQRALSFGVSCLPVDNIEPVAVSLRLLRRGESKPALTVERVVLNGSLQGGWGSGVDLDFVEYELQAESLAADGRVLHRISKPMKREAPPWWQNTLGKDPIVPKPWTPVIVEGSTVRVWGRDFSLGGGGIATGLVSAAAQLLAGSPRFHGRVNGAEVEFEGAAAAFTERSAQAAAWEGELRAPGVRAGVKATIEYDGLLNYKIALRPDGATPLTIDSLVVDFPLNASNATQFIVNGGGHNFRASWVARFVPAGTGMVWNSAQAPWHKGVAVGSFCPLVWIGDDARGLAFFGDNDKGWTPGSEAPAQAIVRTNGMVIYRMNVITRTVKVVEPREFSFYLHPTPTKPLPPDWRSFNGRGANGKGKTRDGVDAFLGYTLTAPSTVFNAGITFAMEPVSWDDAKKNAAQLRRTIHDEPVMFYIDYSWPQMGSSMAEFKPTLWWTGRMTWSREVEDYFVWILNEYISRGIIDGIYIDDVSLGATRGLYSTAYALEGGQTQPGFSTMGFRRFLQRVWVLFEKQGKRPIILPHMTYCFEIPALSFAESAVNGEDRDIGPFAQHSYPDVWSPEELRVMGSSSKWGFVTFWKPGVRGDFDFRFSNSAREWIRWQSRAMHALVIPHDYWYLWTWPTANGIRPVLAKFGVDDPSVRFIPYWNLDGHGSVTGDKTLLTIFARPDKALIMVSNLAKVDQTVTVTVNPDRLFAAGAAGGVTWKDVDGNIMPVETGKATAHEVKAATESMLDGLDEVAPDAASPNAPRKADELLDNSSATDKLKTKWKIEPAGNAAQMSVGKHDYRLIEIHPIAPAL